MFWLTLALFAVSFVLQVLLAPKPPKAQPGQIKPPRVTEGEPIAVVFGVQKVGPNTGWFGDVKPVPIRKSSGFLGLSHTTIGFSYEAGLMAVICEGPVDALVNIVFDDTRYLSQVPAQPQLTGFAGASAVYTHVASCTPALVPNPTPPVGGDKTTFTVWAPALYRGNDAGGEGGTAGTVDFYWGTDTQTPNDYLASASAQNQPVASYTGLCYAVFRRSPGDEPYYWSNSPYLKSVYLVVRRNPSAANGPSTAVVNGVSGDANAAEVIYEWLTNARWGLGRNPAKLDLASFQSAAQTLFDEGLGVAGTIHGDQDAANTVLDLLHHIDGVLYTHPTTGLWTLALIRDDYSRLPGGVTVINAQNASEISIATPTPKERITECQVTYTNRLLDFSARTESVQNAAANARDVDRKIDLEHLPYLSTPSTAQQAAARILRAKSLPLRKASFQCSRAAFGFRLGAPFALECPEQGLDRAFFRVLTADYGTLEDGLMRVEAVEDVFSITGQTLVDSGGSGDPGTQPPGGFRLQLSVDPVQSQTATVGSLELGIDDPDGVVTDVAFQSRQGASAGAGFVSDATAPYQATVALVDSAPSYIDWRVQYTDVDGTTQQVTGTAEFSAMIRPRAPRLSVSFAANGASTIDSAGDGLTATQKIAYSLTAYPDDATTRAAAVQSGQRVTIAGPTLTAGQTLFLAAFAYDVTGALESVKAIGAFAKPMTSDTGRGETILAFIAGDRFRLVHAPVGYAEIDPSQQAWIDLTGAEVARLVAHVEIPGSQGTELATRYSTDATTWTYLDGFAGGENAGGPAVAIDVAGTIKGDLIEVADAAKRDVIVQLLVRNGDNATSPRIGNVHLEYVGIPREAMMDASSQRASLSCYADAAAFEKVWTKILIRVGTQFDATISPVSPTETEPCLLELAWNGGGDIFGFFDSIYYRRQFTGFTPVGTVQLSVYVSKVSGYDVTAAQMISMYGYGFGGDRKYVYMGQGVTSARTLITGVVRASRAGAVTLFLGEFNRSPVENGSFFYDTMQLTEINQNLDGRYVLTADIPNLALYLGQFMAPTFIETDNGTPVLPGEVLGASSDANVVAVDSYVVFGLETMVTQTLGSVSVTYRSAEGGSVSIAVAVIATPAGSPWEVSVQPQSLELLLDTFIEQQIFFVDELSSAFPNGVTDVRCGVVSSDSSIVQVANLDGGMLYGGSITTGNLLFGAKGAGLGTATVTITHLLTGQLAVMTITVQNPTTGDPLVVAFLQAIPGAVYVTVNHYVMTLVHAWNALGTPWDGRHTPGIKPISATSDNSAVATVVVAADQVQIFGVAVGTCNVTVLEPDSGVTVVVPVTVVA